MKHLFIIIFSLLSFWGVSQSFFEKSDAFFQKYVTDGQVDYATLKSQPAELNALVKEIAQMDLSNKRVTPAFMKAFYINAYNVLVIEQVVTRYPIEGPLKVDGFFDRIPHQVMGQEMTLDQLEKKTLYQQFPDPRLHFVLVCAARGCPPLASRAFQPENLDQQLEDRTRFVLNLDWFIRVNDDGVQWSKIFEWYAGDFSQEGSVKDFINDFRKKPLPAQIKTGTYEYDWSLNKR